MTRLVILRPEKSAKLVLLARPARFRERLAARLGTTRLDVELARGVQPEARAALALRAQTLGETRMRTALARSLRRYWMTHATGHGQRAGGSPPSEQTCSWPPISWRG